MPPADYSPTKTDELVDRLMSLDLGYPGISFGYHSWALAAYLDSLEESIGFAQAQHKLRARRYIERAKHHCAPEQIAQELELVDVAAEHISAYARMCALVPIWGIFESTVSDITSYVSDREKAAIKLRDIRAQNFLKQVEKYYKGVLKIRLPWAKAELEKVETLHAVRSTISHRNGLLLDAPEERRKQIEKVAHATPGLSVQANALAVSSTYVSSAAELVFKLLSELNQMVVQRYDGPTI